jgi:hypothetical protein
MRVIELTDTGSEVAYLRRLLTREAERLDGWIRNPGPHSKGASVMRLQEDLALAQSILGKLQ